ncbi:uncharacterized protein LOC120411484 [Corvus cornix cornix]|uniref:uncharacterized protein LOC120411484 n=1 Tax=Corvus cornix cornix TaxID=932674 RepID=UPI00194FF7E2|nr:uncharacterized protein LOC120411484 [Corvus cornix cornix]
METKRPPIKCWEKERDVCDSSVRERVPSFPPCSPVPALRPATSATPAPGRNRGETGRLVSWQKLGFCEVFRRPPRRRLPSENGVPEQRRQRFSSFPGGQRGARAVNKLPPLTLPRRSLRRAGGAGAGGRPRPPISAGQKNVQSKQSPKAALLQGWFHFRERISRLCKKRGKEEEKKSMWLPSSVHKYCRNLQMAALLPNSDHTASPNSMEMN